MITILQGGTPQVQISDGSDEVAIVAANATQDETLAQYMANLSVISGYDGTDLKLVRAQNEPHIRILETTNVINPVLVADTTANDSDKSFTVTSNEQWQILWIFAKLTTTSTVANREMAVRYKDGSGNVIYQANADVSQAQSTTRYYSWHPGQAREAAFENQVMIQPLPTHSWLPAAHVIQIVEASAIAVSADDMEVYLMTNQQSV